MMRHKKKPQCFRTSRKAFSPVNYSATLQLFFKTLPCMVQEGCFLLGRMGGTLTGIETPASNLNF